jgi:amino acid permease
MRFSLVSSMYKYLKGSFYLCLILLFVGLLPIKHTKHNKRSFTKIHANYFTFIPFFALYYAFKLIKKELE